MRDFIHADIHININSGSNCFIDKSISLKEIIYNSTLIQDKNTHRGRILCAIKEI